MQKPAQGDYNFGVSLYHTNSQYGCTRLMELYDFTLQPLRPSNHPKQRCRAASKAKQQSVSVISCCYSTTTKSSRLFPIDFDLLKILLVGSERCTRLLWLHCINKYNYKVVSHPLLFSNFYSNRHIFFPNILTYLEFSFF